MRYLKISALTLLLLLLGPLYQAAIGGEARPDAPRGWQFANRDSSGQSPLPAEYRGAIVQIFAARTYSWRGHLAVHTWVATKEKDADTYMVHQVIGFRERRGLSVRVSQRDQPDRFWYGNQPEVLVDIRGDEAERLLPAVLAAVDSYPYANSYTMWPGPNSNTFTAHVGRSVPELRLALPVTAIGKDYLPGTIVASTPSGTGYQVSLFGSLGVMAALNEGVEVNVLGLALGVDFRRPAVKIPGIGRVGMSASAGEPMQ